MIINAGGQQYLITGVDECPFKTCSTYSKCGSMMAVMVISAGDRFLEKYAKQCPIYFFKQRRKKRKRKRK